MHAPSCKLHDVSKFTQVSNWWSAGVLVAAMRPSFLARCLLLVIQVGRECSDELSAGMDSCKECREGACWGSLLMSHPLPHICVHC